MKTTIIGTGNVAYHLSKRCLEKGIKLVQIVGRNAEKTAWFSDIMKVKTTTDFSKINTKSDIYIIAVSDSAIGEIAEKLSKFIDNQLVVHTSGSMPSTILKPYFKHFGTFYPLQTFSINSQPDFDKIPIFINTTPPQYKADFLTKFATEISPQVYQLSDEKRVVLHIAAVFVNNFTNHLFTIGEKIVGKEDLPFDILKPLIFETVFKIKKNSPNTTQTGPAKRKDAVTVEKHEEYLKENMPEYVDLYKILTESIINQNHNSNQ